MTAAARNAAARAGRNVSPVSVAAASVPDDPTRTGTATPADSHALPLHELPQHVQDTLAAYGATSGGVRQAHAGSHARIADHPWQALTRQQREAAQEQLLAPLATRAVGAGNRLLPEDPDPVRTCFERDLDRIRHSAAFRSLAGKQQVFLYAGGVLRNRLTHSQEVAQVAAGLAQAIGANVDLACAGALAHDLGHSPCGHSGEGALSPYLPGGYDHAVYGADVVAAPLNLCAETLDAVRNHSWKRPAPMTVEGELVSWSDRIAYVCHDFDDAVSAGILTSDQLPEEVFEVVGLRQSEQIRAFMRGIVAAVEQTGIVGMVEPYASALDAFRKFNYERIYLRPAARKQADKAIRLLQELVEHLADHPGQLPAVRSGLAPMPIAGEAAAAELAVHYVAQLTDREVLDYGLHTLGWESSALPRGA